MLLSLRFVGRVYRSLIIGVDGGRTWLSTVFYYHKNEYESRGFFTTDCRIGYSKSRLYLAQSVEKVAYSAMQLDTSETRYPISPILTV